MAARRRSSAGRSARTQARASASSSRASGGKFEAACPQCATLYRVPTELAKKTMRCSNCGYSFVPGAVGKRGLRKKNDPTPFVMGGVLAIVVVGGLWWAASGDPPKPVKAQPKAPPKIEVGLANPRVKGVQTWVDAITSKDTFNTAGHSDFTALAKHLKIEGDPNADQAVQDALVQQLFDGDETKWFRHFETTSMTLETPAMHDQNSGRVLVDMYVRDEHKTDYKGSMQVAVSFEFRDLKSLVQAWEVVRRPVVYHKPEKVYRIHEKIGKPKTVKRNFGGQEIEVEEAELVPLDHLEDTPPALAKEIDELIEGIVDIDGPGYQMNRSIDRLKEIGRPGIPRLLNKFYETKLDSQDNVLRARRIAQGLNQITGQRFGFNPAITKDENAAADDASRISVLKQWYAWWARNHDREFDIAIDKRDDLEEELDDEKEPEGNLRKGSSTPKKQ